MAKLKKHIKKRMGKVYQYARGCLTVTFFIAWERKLNWLGSDAGSEKYSPI